MKVYVFAVVLSFTAAALPLQASAAKVVKPPLTTSQKQSIKIDLNQADAKTLSKAVKGIGKKRAEAIVAYRQEKGPFKSIEELAQVRGLGKQFVQSHLVALQEIFSVN